MQDMNPSPKPNSHNTLKRYSHSILSNAFSASNEITTSEDLQLCFEYKILKRVWILEKEYHFINPVCSSEIILGRIFSKREVKSLTRILTSTLRRLKSRYELHDVGSFPSLSNRVIHAYLNVGGSVDPCYAYEFPEEMQCLGFEVLNVSRSWIF